MQIWVTILSGIFGAIVGAIITGVVEFTIFQKTIKENRNRFNLEIEESHKLFNKEAERFRLEAEQPLMEKFLEQANYANIFYVEDQKSTINACNQFDLELNYLSKINCVITMCNGINEYPPIDSKINQIIINAQFDDDFLSKLSKLRCLIGIYNSKLLGGAPQQQIDDLLNRIHDLANSLKSLKRTVKCNCITNLRKFYYKQSEDTLAKIQNIRKSITEWDDETKGEA